MNHFEGPIENNEDEPAPHEKDTPLYQKLARGYTPYLPDPTPFTLIQPDGTQFEARMVGERIGGHRETVGGYSIIEDDEGWFTFATKNEKGMLAPTENRVGEMDPDTIYGLQKHLSNAYPDVEVDQNTKKHGTRAPSTNSTWKAIAIMIEFTDEVFDTKVKSDFEQLLNGTSGNTMRTFYQENSYGQFDIETDIVGPFTSAYNMTYYGADVGPNDNDPNTHDDGYGPVSYLAREAVQLADSTVDFSQYDLDSDGIIDALFIIHAGNGQEGGGGVNGIWSHMSWVGYATSDGVTAGTYSTEPENGKVGVFAHEFGHILGLPDLYDTDYTSSGIGKWGVMGGGSWNGGGNTPAHFCAWAKIKLGWLEPTIVTSDISLFQVDIPPVENNSFALKIWAHDPAQNTDEYFLIENRQKILYDSALPGAGILVWHIDEAQNNNRDETHYLVDLEEADGDQELEAGDVSQSTDPWRNNITGFRNDTLPNSSSYNGSETGVWVWNFSDIKAGGMMSLGFKERYSGPTGIYISDPQTNDSILPVYDFTISDSDFPDEDIGADNEGNNGSYELEWRVNGTSGPWNLTPSQTMISWVNGNTGIINCTMLIEGFWDFRLRIFDEEGHLFYSEPVYNIAIPTKIPPNADAGPDNLTDVFRPTILDGSNSWDNSGYIRWFNWSFDDGTFQNGTQSIVVHNWSVPGVYQVILNVSDSFGNWDIDTVNITVEDLSSPVTVLSIGTPKYTENPGQSWNVTSNTDFSLASVDNYVGVNFTRYKIDGDYYVYSGIFTFMGYSEGPHDFTWGAEDLVGNNETGNFIVIVVDDTPPITNMTVGAPRYRINPGDIWNVTNTTLLTINSWDQYSGWNYTWYSIESNFSVGNIVTLDGYWDGILTIFWTSVDHVNNYINANYTVRLDGHAPTSDIVVGGPRYRASPGDRWNITLATEISLANITDGTGVGVNVTWYTINGVYYEYAGNFTLPAGLHTITWGSIDFLSQNETGNIIEIFVDDTPPDTSLAMSNPYYGVSPTYVNSTTEISLNASDGLGSGLDFAWYKIDMGPWMQYSGPFKVTIPGLHIIYYNSTDNLGFAESTKSSEIFVDDILPTTTLIIGDPNYGSSPVFVDSTTTFTLTSSDGTGSGIDSTWYKINSGNWVLYSGDFTIASAGPQTLYYYASDNLGQEEAIGSLDIHVDNSAPITTMTIGDPKAESSPIRVGFITSFNLSATDGTGSGVNSIWYNINGAGWILYTGEFYLGISGDNAIYYNSTDNLGHNEFNSMIQVYVDSSPPTTDLNIVGSQFGSDPLFVESTAVYNLTASDGPGTGVASTWYKIDSGSWMKYTGNFSIVTEGFHTIYYNSTDILGQNEITKVQNISVDTRSPVTNITVSAPKYVDMISYVKPATQFTLSADDMGGSGVKKTWYRVDSPIEITYSTPFSVTSSGPHTIYFYSEDNMGHVELEQSLSIYVDTSAPTTTYSIGTPQYGLSPIYLNSTTTISLSATDSSGSGVAQIWYQLNTSGTWELYTGPFTVPGPFYHRIYYYSIDHLNNSESLQGFNIYVDLEAPTSNHQVGDPNYGLSPTYVNIDTTISLSSTDGSGSGVDTTWYRIDSGNWVQYFGAFTLPSSGPHTLYYYSVDMIGQMESQKKDDFIVDTGAPKTNLTVGDPRFRTIDSHDWNVTLDTLFEVYSDDLDLSETWFTINGKYYADDDFTLGYFGLSEGFYTISWGSIDKLGNNETGNVFTVFLDTSTPTTQMTMGNPKYREKPNDLWSITHDTDFYLDSQYKKSGIKATWYTIGFDYYEGTLFDLSGYPDGQYEIKWGTVDNLGHNETGNQMEVILDNDMGFLEIIMGEPRYRASQGDLYNITIQTPFSLSIFDAYADVDHTWYTIDGDNFQGTSFDLNGYGEGLRVITFGTYDNFGTSESWGIYLVNLDKSGPETEMEVHEPKNQVDDHWKITKATEFSLTSSDQYSGVNVIWYTIDGVLYLGTEFDLDGYSDGAYVITFGASDNLDFNESENTIEVIVDNTAPEISIEMGNPNATVNGVTYITSGTRFTLISDDPLSTIFYSTDGGSTFKVYSSPFSVSPSTTEIVYYGVDEMGNEAESESIDFVVNDNDSDDDGKVDLIDEDDDNDGLLDTEEDLNQNGIVDGEESDPLNPDSDFDGHIDSKDKYPQDASRFRDPTDWERVPFFGGYDQSLCINLLIIGIILLIILLYLFRRYRMHRAKTSWNKESERNGASSRNSQNNK